MIYIQKTMELNCYPQNIVRKTICMLYLPYKQGISEKIAAVGRKYNVKVINKEGK